MAIKNAAREAAVTWFDQTLQELQERFDRDRRRHKRNALALRILSVTLSAVATVALGLRWLPMETTLKNIAIFMTATVTVVAAYEAFFQPRELWIRETEVAAHLKDLGRCLAYHRHAGDAGDKLKELKARLDGILDESLKDWLRLRGQKLRADTDSEPA